MCQEPITCQNIPTSTIILVSAWRAVQESGQSNRTRRHKRQHRTFVVLAILCPTNWHKIKSPLTDSPWHLSCLQRLLRACCARSSICAAAMSAPSVAAWRKAHVDGTWKPPHCKEP